MCKTPHKHADIIKAWADGVQIQIKALSGNSWKDVYDPLWSPLREYRIKPEPKPDTIGYLTAESRGICGELTTYRTDCDNVRLTFDGETGKLKAAEVLQ